MCRPTNALVVSYPATLRQTDQSGMIRRCDEQREARNKLEFLPTALMRPVRLPRRTTTTHASTASAFGACGSQFVPIATEDISLSLRSERTARGFVSRTPAFTSAARKGLECDRGVSRAAARRIPTHGLRKGNTLVHCADFGVDLLTPARGVPYRRARSLDRDGASLYPQNGNKPRPARAEQLARYQVSPCSVCSCVRHSPTGGG